MNRREFLQTAAVAGVALGTLPLAKAEEAAKRPPKPGLSIQLYSLRQDTGKDFDEVLQWVAALGLKGVEFAGYGPYGGKPQELRKRLDDLGLVATGTHIGTDSFVGDHLQRTIEFHKTIGCNYLVVPNDGRFYQAEKWRELVDIFNKTAELLKPLGMFCGYHNHTGEFGKLDNKTYFEWFAENTRPEVILQQDCGWSYYAGQNPVALMKKYPGRFRTVHIKPAVTQNDVEGKKGILGQDSVPWKPIFQACRDIGGTRWMVLEQEVYPDGKSPKQCVTESFAVMKKLHAEIA